MCLRVGHGEKLGEFPAWLVHGDGRAMGPRGLLPERVDEIPKLLREAALSPPSRTGGNLQRD